MPLTLVEKNKLYKIKRIRGNPKIKRHLEDLGFTQNESLILISKNHGNIIVNIKNSRIAIGEDLARKIYLI